MASDILIVDDEADIRDLVAGILDDEGFSTRTARDSDSALAEIANRRPHLVFLDIWLQGSQARRPAIARADQEGPRRRAGGDDLRPRQHRDRGRRDQARRLRLHRKAVQVRPADPGGDAGAGNLAAEARGEGTQATGAGRERADRPLGLHEPAAPDHRPGRQGQQPHPDRRPVRLRQGTGGAHAAQRIEPRRRTVRRHQRRGDHAGADGSRAVRHRAVQRRAGAQGRRAGRSPWRHAVHRRNRRHAARDPEQDPARAGRSDLPALRRHRQGPCRRPHHLLDRAQPGRGDRRRAASARISITGCRWCRSACRRCRSGARTFPN